MREVSLEQLYKDIAIGSTVRAEGVRVEPRRDPVVAIRAPLGTHEGRVFFYCGFLYGFCRLDASITERFRAQSGIELKTYLHGFENPLFKLPWFPGFSTTQVSRLLQSAPMGPPQQDLFDFIASQLIVDRKRHRVWAVKMVTTRIPDPYSIDNKEVLRPAEIVVFMPQTWDHGFEIKHKSSMFLGTPEVLQVTREDTEFKTKTEEILRNG